MKRLLKTIREKIKINIFGNKKLLLTFEFAIVISEVARVMNFELTKEVVKRAEDLLLNELSHGSAEKFACNMNSYALAVFEVKEV